MDITDQDGKTGYDPDMIGPDIRNHNEQAVRGEVLRARYAAADDPTRCWCPLCEADVISLTLSSIPPCYGRGHAGGDIRGKASRGFVHQIVRSAVDKIARKPKHEQSGPGPRAHEVRIVDFTFEAAAAIVEDILLREDGCRCDCRECRADTLTLALNRLSPLYGVVWDGRRHLPEERWQLLQAATRRSLAAAARVVSASPYHWVPGHHRPS